MTTPRATLCLFLLASCATPRPTPRPAQAPSARELFPLAVGNRWTYRVRFLGVDQTLSVAIVSGQDGTFIDNRGQRYHEGRGGLRDDQRYLLREPLAEGKSWSSVVSVSSTEHYSVAAVGEAAEVPAGRFAGCVRVEGRTPGGADRAQLAEQTYCPGVGLVRVVTYEEISGRRGPPQWQEELVAFRVAAR